MSSSIDSKISCQSALYPNLVSYPQSSEVNKTVFHSATLQSLQNVPKPTPSTPQTSTEPLAEKKIELFKPEEPKGEFDNPVSWKEIAILTLFAVAMVLTATFLIATIYINILFIMPFLGALILAELSGLYIPAMSEDQYAKNAFAYSQSLPEGAQKHVWEHKAARFNKQAAENEKKFLDSLKDSLISEENDEMIEARIDNLIEWVNFSRYVSSSQQEFKKEITALKKLQKAVKNLDVDHQKRVEEIVENRVGSYLSSGR